MAQGSHLLLFDTHRSLSYCVGPALAHRIAWGSDRRLRLAVPRSGLRVLAFECLTIDKRRCTGMGAEGCRDKANGFNQVSKAYREPEQLPDMRLA